MRSETITVRTGGSPVVRDITAEAADFVKSEEDGLLHVFVPHATAGLAIIETGAGSDDDLLAAVDELLRRRTSGVIGTVPADTVATTCCRPGSRRTRPCRSFRAGSLWAPGSRSAW
jgi:hypothetical protein